MSILPDELVDTMFVRKFLVSVGVNPENLPIFAPLISKGIKPIIELDEDRDCITIISEDCSIVENPTYYSEQSVIALFNEVTGVLVGYRITGAAALLSSMS